MENFLPNRVARLQATVSRQKQTIAELGSEVSELRTKIAGMEKSRSWRITAPLRRVSGLCAPKPRVPLTESRSNTSLGR